jgi:hypothetical protein
VSTATSRAPLDVILSRLPKHRKHGHGFRAKCPAHDGISDNSLSIKQGDNGDALLHCFSGCAYGSIMEALGLEESDGFVEPLKGRGDGIIFDIGQRASTNGAKPQKSYSRSTPYEAEYDYEDEDANLLYSVRRYANPKAFRPFIPGVDYSTLNGVKKIVPYRLPEILASGGIVLIAEGEKDVHQLEDRGFVATCNHGGAGKWTDEHSQYLSGRDVVVISDNDKPGRDHSQKVAASLAGIAASVKVIDSLPGLAEPGADVSDWFAAGGTAEQLASIMASAPEWTAPDLLTMKVEKDPELIPEPELHEAALHGLLGDIWRVYDPYTEAHPAAVIATLIVYFGNCAGRSPHTFVGDTRHGLNHFAVIVGATSRSRKGTSSAPAERMFREVDQTWLYDRKADGIGSGEAIVWAIRDPSEPKENPKTGETVIEDQGVEDKRLMIHEEEFSSQLKVIGRDGSIAGETMRKCWDSREVLRNMVKSKPIKATNPHVSLLGHITEPELRQTLTETDQANGVGNRIMWVHAKRSKLLPDGERIPDATLAPLICRMRDAIYLARQGGQINRDPDTADLWRQVYPDLSKDYPGLFGSLTARAEAHVLRLSMTYALLDCSTVVRVEHLKAALAFWRYCEDTARYIFGDRTGDPVADRILGALRASGELRESDLHDLFGRNQKADRIAAALQSLLTYGLVTFESRATGGRPARYWRATR